MLVDSSLISGNRYTVQQSKIGHYNILKTNCRTQNIGTSTAFPVLLNTDIK